MIEPAVSYNADDRCVTAQLSSLTDVKQYLEDALGELTLDYMENSANQKESGQRVHLQIKEADKIP